MAASDWRTKIRFNASLCKSGSELLQALLGQHPRVFATATSPVVDYLCAMRRARGGQAAQAWYPEERELCFLEGCLGFMEGFYLPFLAKDDDPYFERGVVVDKSREWLRHMGWMGKVLGQEETRCVCMVRDLRDVIASFERTYRAHGDVAMGPTPEMTDEDVRKAPGVIPLVQEERIQKWMTVTPPLGPTLKALKEAERQDMLYTVVEGEPLPDEAHMKRSIMCLRYEDLLESPIWAMRQVERHLMLSEHEYNFTDIQRDPKLEIPGAFGPYGDHTVGGALGKLEKDGFADVLREEDEIFIGHHAQWYFELFKYI